MAREGFYVAETCGYCRKQLKEGEDGLMHCTCQEWKEDEKQGLEPKIGTWKYYPPKTERTMADSSTPLKGRVSSAKIL